eukprot:1154551-Pelagomonas_calceolata.AAC.5
MEALADDVCNLKGQKESANKLKEQRELPAAAQELQRSTNKQRGHRGQSQEPQKRTEGNPRSHRKAQRAIPGATEKHRGQPQEPQKSTNKRRGHRGLYIWQYNINVLPVAAQGMQGRDASNCKGPQGHPSMSAVPQCKWEYWRSCVMKGTQGENASSTPL